MPRAEEQSDFHASLHIETLVREDEHRQDFHVTFEPETPVAATNEVAAAKARAEEALRASIQRMRDLDEHFVSGTL